MFTHSSNFMLTYTSSTYVCEYLIRMVLLHRTISTQIEGYNLPDKFHCLNTGLYTHSLMNWLECLYSGLKKFFFHRVYLSDIFLYEVVSFY